MLVYSEEPFFDTLEELMPLINNHYKEVSTLHKQGVDLDIDYDTYKYLDDLDRLCLVVAREDSKIVGYTLSFCIPQLHYKETILSYNDAIYVIPEKRNTLTGYRLIKETEKIMKDKGVDVFTLHIKTEHDWSGLAIKMGYQEVEKIYHKGVS